MTKLFKNGSFSLLTSWRPSDLVSTDGLNDPEADVVGNWTMGGPSSPNKAAKHKGSS